MKKLMLFFMGVIAFTSMYSQGVLTPFEDWSTTAGTQNFFHKGFTRTVSNYVYVAGATVTGAGDYDMLLTKTSNTGVLQWTKQYDGLAHYHDVATDVYVDGSNNVYITGVVVNDTTGLYSDCITIKYNSSGVQQWVATYNGTGSLYDAGAKVIEDGSGNVYVCGGAYNASLNKDYLVIKYNSSGTQQWAVEYDGTAHMDDAAVKVGISSGKLVVLGVSQATSTTYKPLTLQMNLSTGAIISATYSGSSGTSTDIINDVYKDASGNFYLVGGTPTATRGYDFTTIKLTAATLALAWQTDYNSTDSLDDIASGVQVDGSGNVYVTGYTTSATQQKNMLTIKYNSSGAQQWLQTYNDTLNGNDEASSIVLDGSNNVYVSGYDSTALNSTDYYTIKYDNSGTEQWNIRTDGDAHFIDKVTDMAIDTVGNIIVTGESQKADGSFEYKTVRYAEYDSFVPKDFNGEDTLSTYLFYQNKGQLIKTDSTAVPLVKYYTNNTSPLYYFMGDTLSTVFISTDTMGIDSLHRINITYTNSNSNKHIYALNETPELVSYYLGSCQQGITELHGNKQLFVPNLYSDIDLMYTSNQNGIKYYFIVKPGGNLGNIRMHYSGASSTNLNTGTQELTVNSLIGHFTYDQPTFYQVNSSNAIVALSDGYASWHNYSSDTYGFDSVTVLDSTKIMIIEVDEGNSSVASTSAISNLEWCTYAGGDASDGATAVTTDKSGNPFMTGTTWSSNFPVNTTYQVYSAAHPSKLGSQDIFVMAFDKVTRRVTWATYLGGSGIGSFGGTTAALDRANDIKAYKGTDPTKNYVYVTGTTWSGDFPVVNVGIFSSALSMNNSAGLIRMVIAAFRQSTGIIDWSTCHGGTSTTISEEGTSLDVYTDGTLVIGGALTGISGSTSAPYVPYVTPGGAYTKDDASGFFVLFNNSYQVSWFTLIGSIGGYVDDVFITKEQVGGGGFEKKAYVVGKAANGAHPMDLVPNPGNEYYQSSFGGGSFDGYISRFNIESSYALEYSSYWGGNGNDDVIAIEGTDKVLYFGGVTQSSNLSNTELPDPGGSAYNNTTLNGSSDGFILRCDPLNQNNLDWGTLYGGNQNDAILDMCLDVDGRLYATGETRSTSGLINSTAAGFYSQNILGNDSSSTKTDGFILVFNSSNVDVHQTYLGGTYPDGGAGIATDFSDYIFLTGASASPQSTFPVVEFSTSSPLDWYDGDFTNNGATGGYMPATYARQSAFTYESVYEGYGPQSADAYIAGFKIHTSLSIGIAENSDPEAQVSLYPNPVGDMFTLFCDNDIVNNASVTIMNMLGQEVRNNIRFQGHYLVIDVAELNAGMYFVAIKNKNLYLRIKFIKG